MNVTTNRQYPETQQASAKPIRLLLVDDHPILRRGLSAIVEDRNEFVVVAEAAEGREALESYRRSRPDVVVMDIRMPVMDGIAAVRALRAEFPAARILLLSSFDADEDIFRGLQAGALGYLIKEAAPDQLLRALRTVSAGVRFITPEIGAKLAARMTQNLNDGLTEREIEILQQMTCGQNNQEIARTLQVSCSTVKYHVYHILAKLDVRDRTQAVLAALRRGLARLPS